MVSTRGGKGEWRPPRVICRFHHLGWNNWDLYLHVFSSDLERKLATKQVGTSEGVYCEEPCFDQFLAPKGNKIHTNNDDQKLCVPLRFLRLILRSQVLPFVPRDIHSNVILFFPFSLSTSFFCSHTCTDKKYILYLSGGFWHPYPSIFLSTFIVPTSHHTRSSIICPCDSLPSLPWSQNDLQGHILIYLLG